MNVGDFVKVSINSDLWTKNDEGFYPQPLIEKNIQDFGYQVRAVGNAKLYPDQIADVDGRIGQISHIINVEDGEGNKEEQATICVRFDPDLMEQCMGDWYNFRESDLTVVTLTEEEQFDFLDQWF